LFFVYIDGKGAYNEEDITAEMYIIIMFRFFLAVAFDLLVTLVL
jgi:hypothetical protein